MASWATRQLTRNSCGFDVSVSDHLRWLSPEIADGYASPDLGEAMSATWNKLVEQDAAFTEDQSLCRTPMLFHD